MLRLVLVTFAIALSLVGCVSTTAVKPTAEEAANADSVIELVIAYRRASQAGLINPMEPFVDAQSNENVKVFSNGWCVKTGSSGEELVQYVRAHCERRGGVLDNEWCTTAGGDVPIYKARIEATKACSGEAWMKEWSWINAAIVEPADGKRAGFVEAAKRIGFRPASDVARERQREQQKADSEARIARARHEQQRVVLGSGRPQLQSSGGERRA